MPVDLIEKTGDVFVIRMPGDTLFAGSVEVFRRVIEPLLDDHPRLVLDMRGVYFMDSLGLGALITCRTRANAGGGDLKLFGLEDPVFALLELVHMDRKFDIFETKEEAVSAFDL